MPYKFHQSSARHRPQKNTLYSYFNIEDCIARDHPLRWVKVLADVVLRAMAHDEHFNVDGSPLRARASHMSLAARDCSDAPTGPDQGRNPEVNFRGGERSNVSHVSRTDPHAFPGSNGGGGAYLSFTTHAGREPEPSTAAVALRNQDPRIKILIRPPADSSSCAQSAAAY